LNRIGDPYFIGATHTDASLSYAKIHQGKQQQKKERQKRVDRKKVQHVMDYI
jgi:hypothetical protein